MNYLAHAFLSFGDPELLTGNMIADHVKGKKALDAYPERIGEGILLHRKIDAYTDCPYSSAFATYRVYTSRRNYCRLPILKSAICKTKLPQPFSINTISYEARQSSICHKNPGDS